MSFIFVVCEAVVMWAEVQETTICWRLARDSSVTTEGKETRFWRAAQQPACRRHDRASLRGW